MNIKNEITVLCNILQITESKLADELNVNFESINNWKSGKKAIDLINLEKLYSYAYSKGIKFNNIYEQLIKEDYENKNTIILFHGAKKTFSMPINFQDNSKKTNDFGVGFYLGETFGQAANYISFIDKKNVYCFSLDLTNLKIYKYNVDNEWMITIAYFRGWLNEYKDSAYIINIINKLKDYDVIVAPIADNRMFDIISEFVEGFITDEQCKHALAATNLGFQYVIKTNKAVNNLKLISEMFVCEKEKGECIENRVSLNNNGIQKVKMARIEYKGKGKYIEEIMK